MSDNEEPLFDAQVTFNELVKEARTHAVLYGIGIGLGIGLVAVSAQYFIGVLNVYNSAQI